MEKPGSDNDCDNSIVTSVSHNKTTRTHTSSSGASDSDSDLPDEAPVQEYSFVELRFGSQVLLYNGYLFRLERTNANGSKKYRCRSHGFPVRCAARVYLNPQGLLILRKVLNGELLHCHENDRHDLIEYRVKSLARASVLSTPTRSLLQIYTEVLCKIQAEYKDIYSNAELFAAIPVFSRVKATLTRARRQVIPKCPDKRENITLTEPWTVCANKKPFLLINDGAEDKILVFGTVEFLGLLCNAKQVFMDGTFYTTPKLFYQMYTIHAQVRNTMMPMLYALLPNKNEETYTRLLRAIQDVSKTHGLSFCPKQFQVDFERAAINAVKFLYQPSDVKGCYFHFTQAVWRRVRSYGLAELYSSDMLVRQMVKRMTAMPLLKPMHIRRVWNQIQQAAPLHYSGITELIAYFSNTWIKPGALFSPLELWNHHGNYTTRTNNDLEGWHSLIKRFFGKSNPTLYDFITMIRVEQAKSELNLSFLYSGQHPRPKQRKYIDKNDRIELLTKGYLAEPETALTFLDAIGNLMKLACTSDDTTVLDLPSDEVNAPLLLLQPQPSSSSSQSCGAGRSGAFRPRPPKNTAGRRALIGPFSRDTTKKRA